MNKKQIKSKEERLFEMYVNAYISETEFYRMWERIKKSKECKENK